MAIIVSGIDSGRKQANLGHAVAQTVRPNVMMTSLRIHHIFAPRFLRDSIHQHGFCGSYEKFHMFEKSVVIVSEGEFGQYATDDIDHNIRNLVGRGTFLEINIIPTRTPGKFVPYIISWRKITINERYRAEQIMIGSLVFTAYQLL